MIFGGGPIYHPPAASHSLARGISETAMKLGQVCVFESKEMKFGWAHGHRFIFFAAFLESSALRMPSDGDQQKYRQSRADRQKTALHPTSIIAALRCELVTYVLGETDTMPVGIKTLYFTHVVEGIGGAFVDWHSRLL